MSLIPARKGAHWNDAETQQLLNEIRKKKTTQEIAAIHERTTTSITHKLTELAADYHFFEDRPIEEIMKYTGLTYKQVVNAIERRKAKNLLAHKRRDEQESSRDVMPITPEEVRIEPAEVLPILTLSVPDANQPSLTEIMEVLKDIQRKVAVLEKVRIRLETPV